MIVTGGKFKGKKLKTPKDKSFRPSSALVKQSLFNILAEEVLDSVFLDLYAGSAAVSIEAISRGAKEAIIIEKNPENIKLINYNIELTGQKQLFKVINASVDSVLPTIKNIKADLIFIDPPYNLINFDFLVGLFNLLSNSEILHSKTKIILESSAETNIQMPDTNFFQLLSTRKYGKSSLDFWLYL